MVQGGETVTWEAKDQVFIPVPSRTLLLDEPELPARQSLVPAAPSCIEVPGVHMVVPKGGEVSVEMEVKSHASG